MYPSHEKSNRKVAFFLSQNACITCINHLKRYFAYKYALGLHFAQVTIYLNARLAYTPIELSFNAKGVVRFAITELYTVVKLL